MRIIKLSLKFIIRLSNLNIVLSFIGFQLVTSIFLPAVSGKDDATFLVTVPYRAFSLVVSSMLILLNIRKMPKKIPLPLFMFLLFWVLWIVRMYYDINIRTDFHFTDTSQLWLYVFGICIPAILSVLFTYQKVELEKVLMWITGLIFFILLLTVITNPYLLKSSDSGLGRLNANIAISSISFGHFGTTSILLGLYLLIKRNLNLFQKLITIILILLGTFCMLRAGSRGPILALFVVLLFWLVSNKSQIWGIFVFIFVSILIIVFMNQILEILGEISPVIEARLRETIFLGSTGGRDPYYSNAFHAFLDSPIFGKQFVIFFPNGTYDYSHNLILDAMMGLGIFGGCAMIYILFEAFRKSYYLIKNNDEHFWMSLLLIQQIIFNMLSSAFYYNQLLCVLLTFIFLYKRNKFNLPVESVKGLLK